MPSFGTAINCMDGRVQLPVIEYLKNRFNVTYIDMITEPGPNKLLAEQTNPDLLQRLYEKINISVNVHESQMIAVVGHHDCAGNPAPVETQYFQLQQSVENLKLRYPNVGIIPLWVNEHWDVQEID